MSRNDDEPFVCYECKDERHDHCVGIPCMCDCPIPNDPDFNTEQSVEDLEM